MDLKSLENGSILLFGKSRAFSKDEFDAQMHSHKIRLVQEYSEDVNLVVDGRMMTPYEQNESDRLYEEQGVQSISIDVLEKLLAEEIDADVLLMSLKLSHDKERLKSFILNAQIDDALFFKLIKMYKWNKEDFFESDDNRDVSAAFISRFYENIERNHNVQFATTGFIHLASQAKRGEILEAIYNLEPIRLHPKIKKAIAMNPYLSTSLQKRIFKRDDGDIVEALSRNANLDKSIVEEMIKEKKCLETLAEYLKLDDALFEKLREYQRELALNESLTLMMQERLFESEDKLVYHSLAQNPKLDAKIIKKLFDLEEEEIDALLLANKATPLEYLQSSYEQGAYLASLASNENTPIEILYQLQLDSRYERVVKTNAGFGKHIQSENIGWLV